MGWLGEGSSEQPGYSTFLRDGNTIFHTYSVYREAPNHWEGPITSWTSPRLGRQEEWEEPKDRVLDARASSPDFTT